MQMRLKWGLKLGAIHEQAKTMPHRFVRQDLLLQCCWVITLPRGTQSRIPEPGSSLARGIKLAVLKVMPQYLRSTVWKLSCFLRNHLGLLW